MPAPHIVAPLGRQIPYPHSYANRYHRQPSRYANYRTNEYATDYGHAITLSNSVGGTQPPGSGASVAEVNKYLVIETPKGRIVAKLYTSQGVSIVRTVANFAERINSGVLDGSTFFRVETWFVQGGGDPDATSRLPAEYNKIPFTAGSVALAHGVDSAFNSDSQFLIAKTDAPQLNDQYTNLGQIVEGMDIVNKISAGDKMTKVRVVSDKY